LWHPFFLAFSGSAKGSAGHGGGHDNSASIRARVQALESQIRHLKEQIAYKQRFMNLSSGTGSVYVGIPSEQRREMQAEIDHINSRITELERQIREAKSESN
jgi:chromosome segregation ATPase